MLMPCGNLCILQDANDSNNLKIHFMMRKDGPRILVCSQLKSRSSVDVLCADEGTSVKV